MRRVLVLGGTGFLGRHVLTALDRRPAATSYGVWGVGRVDVDLLDGEDLTVCLDQEVRPDGAVIHLAYPGSRFGIATSQQTPFDLAADLVQMDLNVIRASAALGVSKLLCVGSVCAYPESTTLPTDESQLWNGYPEPVNAAYGLAKRTQLMLLQAARQQYGLHGIHLILANLYGPGDRSGHVIPSLITKIRRAKMDGGPVVVWGRPEVTRSFLYVEDAAEGIVRALEGYDAPEPLNLTSREEIPMRELVTHLAYLLGYDGPVVYDGDQPTGHRRRLFDTTRLQQALGWIPATPFYTGLATTVAWHLAHVPLEGVPDGR